MTEQAEHKMVHFSTQAFTQKVKSCCDYVIQRENAPVYLPRAHIEHYVAEIDLLSLL